MTPINANTKISSLLKQDPNALEAIVSLSPKFKKLRNPILRKVIAARTSIAMAAKIGGCTEEDFFSKLQALGFTIDKLSVKLEKDIDNKPIPGFMKNLSSYKIIELDVRPLIETGKDPLDFILQIVTTLKSGSVLKIINSFEPTPLILLLAKQGFESYAETVSDEQVDTFFYKSSDKVLTIDEKEKNYAEGWDLVMDRFNAKLVTVDVRKLEMPKPMFTILETLKNLPNEKALFVYHKRIPVFLLAELDEQQFSYRIKEINDCEVHMLIYKN